MKRRSFFGALLGAASVPLVKGEAKAAPEVKAPATVALAPNERNATGGYLLSPEDAELRLRGVGAWIPSCKRGGF